MQNIVYFEIFILLFSIEIKSAMYKTDDVKSSTSNYFLKGTRLWPLCDKNYFLLLQCNKGNTKINKSLKESSVIQGGKHNFNKANNSKPYEIIDMLRRKTRKFTDVENYTENYRQEMKDHKRFVTKNTIQNRNPFQLTLNPIRIHTSRTPSYIEFYYLHEIDDFVQNSNLLNSTIYNGDKVSKITLQQTKDPTEIQNKVNCIRYEPLKLKTHKLSIANNSSKHIAPMTVENNLCVRNKINKKTQDFIYNYTSTVDHKLNKEEYNIKSTTFYDKIKFFEIYDNQTQIPVVKKNIQDVKNNYNITNNTRHAFIDYIRNDIGHVDNRTRHYYVKKHIAKKEEIVYQQSTKNSNKNINSTRTPILLDLRVKNKEDYEETAEYFQVEHESHDSETLLNCVNKSTFWTEYPFIAVYIYKPLQVHCDAASISPHWLIASASCLSRHRGNLNGQSAFVTYCGSNWWLPERVAYVKYSLIHPRYHPRDRIRRQLYNIGVIQIVNSMASACPSWSPVPLMSHQFTANTGGFKATAVGWGLDRFDTRYTSIELPKRPLSSYESVVYSESCPGHLEYSKGRYDDEDVGISNLYCLSLPPYNGEDNDPTHGGILLVEEKLIALYLQEERRPRGEQSAQYTGTWRLIPWVFDVAQEFTETDTFTIDA